MRRMMVVGAVILAIVAVVGIGIAAFNAGVDEGISRELAHSGTGDQVVRVVGPGYGWGYGVGFHAGVGVGVEPALQRRLAAVGTIAAGLRQAVDQRGRG